MVQLEYYLLIFNKEGTPIHLEPIKDNKITFPKDTYYIELCERKLISENNENQTYYSKTLFNFVPNTVKRYYTYEGNCYLKDSKTLKRLNWVHDNNFKTFKTKEELLNYVQTIVNYICNNLDNLDDHKQNKNIKTLIKSNL